MQDVNTQVLGQADIDANPLLLNLGGAAGDTLTITRPDVVDPAPAPQTDQSTKPAEEVPPAPEKVDEQAVDPAPEKQTEEVTLSEGDACTTLEGKPGKLVAQGSKAAGTLALVCIAEEAAA